MLIDGIFSHSQQAQSWHLVPGFCPRVQAQLSLVMANPIAASPLPPCSSLYINLEYGGDSAVAETHGEGRGTFCLKSRFYTGKALAAASL